MTKHQPYKGAESSEQERNTLDDILTREIIGFRKPIENLSEQEKRNYRIGDELCGLGFYAYLIDYAILGPKQNVSDFQI